MRLLLDTHIFLRFISGDTRLPGVWRQGIRDGNNEVYVSVVSLREALVTHRLAKLPLPEPPESYLPIQRARHQLSSLSLNEASVQHLATLPSAHRDLFDRMLVCQALEHGLAIVTVDPVSGAYPAPILSRTLPPVAGAICCPEMMASPPVSGCQSIP